MTRLNDIGRKRLTGAVRNCIRIQGWHVVTLSLPAVSFKYILTVYKSQQFIQVHFENYF